VPGLGTSYGRGGATTFAMDLRHADSILIMGSNMAECHPVAFRWVVQAKTREPSPCTVIHADPRFTRTSALADVYAPLRAGSDIVFLGALIKYVLDRHTDMLRGLEGKDRRAWSEREGFFHDYLTRYTNALALIREDYEDTEELKEGPEDRKGVFSGLADGTYDPRTWGYQHAKDRPVKETPKEKDDGRKGRTSEPHGYAARVGAIPHPPGLQAKSLNDEHCVFQLLRKHFGRYTPELVEEVCGTPRAVFYQVAEALYANAGPDKTGAICYAVGWTQHTTGVQMIRAAAVLQLLLGNVGRPGGGILALRGHATIQGSTDIATLYNLHPGYLDTPSALLPHDTIYDYIAKQTSASSYWSNTPSFLVSQLRAWFGADVDLKKGAKGLPGEVAYDYLPKIVGDHSHLPMFVQMSKGQIKGFFAMGQNPAVGGQNASFQRRALAKLDWLVVRDLYETETASFWKDSPEVRNGTLKTADIPTEVFFLPAAAVAEGDGSFTNTQRLVQWHEKAVDPPGDARTDIWFTVHLGLRLKELYKDSKEKRDRPLQALVWDYIDEEENKKFAIKDEPSARLILKEINGYHWEAGKSLLESRAMANLGALKDDGSTACGAWIYAGVFAPTKEEPKGHNHAANRKGDHWVAQGWAFSWPANRRILYNRCSADPAGRPWAKEARLAREHARSGGPHHAGYVYWDAGAKQWRGLDVPDFPTDKAPDTPADPEAVGLACHDGASPFIMKADGKGWLFVPDGLLDGPLPTHYEPYESPVPNRLYPKQQRNPAALYWKVPGNEVAKVGDPDYPHVLSTYRLTEHHLSGVMSRWLPWLAELMPELFCEISPEHAAQIGVRNTDWVRIRTPRGSIRAKALVTRRIRPFRLAGGKVVHHVGLPWHWGYKGLTTGDVVNDLSALVADPNVTIHEAKVFVCNVEREQ
jgi:formate dehydrogenase major subunit